jgi:MFS family permease
VGASNAQLGLILLAVALGALPAMLVTGRLAERAGPRLVPLAVGAFAVAGMLPALVPSPWVLFALLLLVGASTGAFDVAINVRASAMESSYGVRVMDGLHAAFSAGVVVGGIGAGLLRRAGVHPSWILFGVGLVLLAIAYVNRGGENLPQVVAEHAPLARALLVVGAVLALAFLVESGVETWSALYIENGLHSSPAVSGLGPGLFAAAMLTGRLIAQRAAPPSAALRMAFAGGAAAVGLAIAAAAASPAPALVGFVVAGLGLALSAPTLFRAAGALGGASAISTVAVVSYLGFVAGPPLIGAVAGATSVRGGIAFLAAAGAALVTTAAILR